MLKVVFEHVLLLSFLGSLVILLLEGIRPLTQRWFDPQWHYYRWFLALAAFVFPVFAGKTSQPQVVYRSDVMPYFTDTKPLRHVSEYLGEPVRQTVDWLQIAAWIWIIGMVAGVVYKLVRYGLFLKALKKQSAFCKEYAVEKSLQVRYTACLDAPLLVGLWTPTLYLPETVSKRECYYILLHEQTHYRRRDIWIKWLFWAVCTVHWFNPMAYWLSFNVNRDCEASCDFAVTRQMETADQAEYMNTILNLMSAGISPKSLSTQMAGSKRTISYRFSAICKGKTMNPKRRLCALLLLLMIVLFSLGIGGVVATAAFEKEVVYQKWLQPLITETPVLEESVTAPTMLSASLEQETTVLEPETAVFEEEAMQAGEVVDRIYEEPMTVEQLLSRLQKSSAEAVVLPYQSDSRETVSVLVSPDDSGKIGVFFESPQSRMSAEVVLKSKTGAEEWGYRLPTDAQTVYEFGGLNPNNVYELILCPFCPGNYGVLGRILIF